MFRCGKRLESFTLTHCWGTSALDDGFEAVGFEVVARIRGGLRVGVGADLNAKILVRAGGDDESGKFFLLQRLREGQGVSFALDGRDCGFRRLQMGPGIVDRRSLFCTRRNGHIGSQSWRMVMSFDGQSDALQASRLFPDRRFWITSS